MNYFHTTVAKGEVCPRCRTITLTAWDEGLHTRVDIMPINTLGQIQAIFAGRETYVLTGGQLIRRDCGRMKMRGPILIRHKCGTPTPPEWQQPAAPITMPKNETGNDERIPF